MQLANIGQQATMSSLEMVDFINSQRGDGEAELRHDSFMAKVPKVIGAGVQNFRDTYKHPQNGQTYPCYRFPKREACLMAMSYSYDLQAKVFDRMTELEAKQAPALPQTYKAALLALVAAEEEKELLLLTNENLSTALDALLEWVSIIKVAKHNGVSEKLFKWQTIKKASEQLGYVVKKAESPRFGYQNLYHVAAFKACYPQYKYDFKD